MYDHLGAGWSISILSGLCLAGMPIPFLLWTRAQAWREARERRAHEKTVRNEEKAREVEKSGAKSTAHAIRSES